MCEQESLPSLAIPPFDDDDADVLVLSSDGYKFRLYKVILGKASPVFKDMFRLPQSSEPANKNFPELVDGLPPVHLTEDAHTLKLLFSFCYPIEHPQLSSLNDVHRVLEAAIKYEMDTIVAHTRKAWPVVASQDPLRAFAIACRRRWEGEARLAAHLTLRESVWPLDPPLAPEFKVVSADTIVRLISYHRRCGAAAKSCVQNSEWVSQIFNTVACSHCQVPTSATTQAIRLRDWYNRYTRQAAEALLAQPAGCIVQKDDFVMNVICTVYGTPPCDLTIHCMEKIKAVVALFGEELDKAISKVVLDLDL